MKSNRNLIRRICTVLADIFCATGIVLFVAWMFADSLGFTSAAVFMLAAAPVCIAIGFFLEGLPDWK